MAAWSVTSSARLCGIGEETLFVGKAVLLDKVQFSSVTNAVEQLNSNADANQFCPNGFCVVFSVSYGEYFLLYRDGKRQEAYNALNLPSPVAQGFYVLVSTTSFICASASYVLLACVDMICPVSNQGFDARKLAGGVHTGLLTDRYDVIRQLGTGAQGIAHLVKRKGAHPLAEFLVAKGSNDTSFHAMLSLKDEFSKMQELRHPNCIKVIELVESVSPRQIFIVSEFARGGDLYNYMHEALNGGGMTEAKVANLVEQAMRGVAYLHNVGYLHNDLKPDNILLMDQFNSMSTPRVVIGDLGCATSISGGHKSLGDPRYLAPECMRAFADSVKSNWSTSEPQTTPKSDVWSMGATLYELLSGGSIPFLYKPCTLPIDTSTLDALVAAVCGSEALQPYMLHAETEASSDVLSLLGLMLQKDASERPDAQEVLKHSWFVSQSLHSAKPRRQMSGISMKHINLVAAKNQVRQVLLTALAATLRYEHVKECHAIFLRLDPDNTGTIPHESFSKACKQLHIKSDDAESVFQSADIDNSGTLEFNEFIALTLDWQTLDEGVLDRHLDDLINRISGRDDGVVSLQNLAKFFNGALDFTQLQQALACNGGSITKNDLKSFVRRTTST